MLPAPQQASFVEVIGAHVEGVSRLVLRHERARTFRPWGLLELSLKVMGAIVMFPFWIYLLVVGLGSGGEGEGGDTGASRPAAPKQKRRKFPVSSLWNYHHDVVVEVVGPQKEVLAQARARPRSEDEGRGLVGSALRLAQAHRLTVVEAVGLEGTTGPAPSEIAQVWYGGRPLMAPPLVRDAAGVEEALRGHGFEFVREPGRVVARRLRPHSPVLGPVLMVAGLGAFVVLGAVLNPLYALFVTPAALFAAFLMRRQLGAFWFELLGGVTRQRERHELVLTPHEVTCESRHAWRSGRISTEGDELVAVGCVGTLTWDAAVQRELPRLVLVGQRRAVALPPRLTLGCASLVNDWVVATLVGLREQAGVHDWRVKCAWCSALVDFDARTTCHNCGGARLAA